jgi:outer membrane biosynthesis protein TonB
VIGLEPPKCRENLAQQGLSRLATMRQLTAFALAIAAATALASCGGEEDAQLLPGSEAREITANLDAVEQLASEGECSGAEEAAGQVSAQVESLEGVDAELQRALERGAARLNAVLASCEEEEVEEPEPAPETSEGDDEDEEKEREKEEKEREREEEKAEKEAEQEEKEEEREPPPAEEVEPPADPSGGISPGAAVEEDDD